MIDALLIAGVILYAGFCWYLSWRRTYAVSGHLLRSFNPLDWLTYAVPFLLVFLVMLAGWWVVILWNYGLYKYYGRRATHR